MNIQYSKKKQEIRNDPVMDSLFSAKKFVAEKSNAVIAVVVGALIVLGGYTVYKSMQERRVAKAQEAFGNAMVAYAGSDRQKATEALSAVTETQSGTPQAAYSAFLLGSMLANDGRYAEAIRWYEVARTKVNANNVVGAMALEALGTCYEQTGNLDKAVELLTLASRHSALAFRQSALQWKLALIARGQGDLKRAEELCVAIVADTTAAALKPDAENLLAVIRNTSAN